MENLLFAIEWTVIVLGLIILIKARHALWQHRRILNAIDNYLTDLINNKDGRVSKEYIDEVFDSIEDFEATAFRLWDWGYKNIVTPELYEEIKDYIE